MASSGNQSGQAATREIPEENVLLLSFRAKEPYKKRPWSQRYNRSLRQMVPVRGASKEPEHVMPGPARGCLSFFSLHWMTGLLWKAYRGTMDATDVWYLRPEDACHENCDRLERHWADELATRGEKDASLSRAMMRAFRTRIIVSTVAMVVAVVLQFVGPSILLARMMTYVNKPDAPYTEGLIIFLLMMVCQFGRTYCFYGMSYVISTFSTFRASGAIQLMIYRKMLRLRVTSEQVLGKIVNICINDMERLFEAFTTGPLVFSAIGMFIFAAVFNLIMIGPWSLVGFGLILLCYPILGGLAAVTSWLRLELVMDTDRRVNLMSEILGAIRLIKMYGWEGSFRSKVMEVRHDEHKVLQKAAFITSFSNTVSPFVSVMASVATILGYVLSGNQLSAPEAFATFSVFNAMQFSIGTLPYGIKMVTEVLVALRRTKVLMLQPEMELTRPLDASSNLAIDIDSGTFAWEKPVSLQKKSRKDADMKRNISKASMKSTSTECSEPDPPPGAANGKAAVSADERMAAETATEAVVVLHELSLQLRPARLVGIAGSVGSGKSSLLAAIMGQLRTLSGSVRCSGRLAVVSQTAWIFGGTLRDNILFGAPLKQELYNTVLDVCALRSDIQMMKNGDLSQIGERGLNLSGGQKQRVNMARAVYSEADVYLLDDPLSAVDSSVGKHIFNHCIRGHLKGKTILLVSHGVQYLSECDEVLMMKDGRLVERGPHSELMERRGEYFKLVSYDDTAAHGQEQKKPDEDRPLAEGAAPEAEHKPEEQFTAEETTQKQLHFFRLLYLYMKPAGLVVMSFVVFLVALFGISRTGTGIFLKYWLDAGDGLMEERIRNMTEYNTTYLPDELPGFINDHPQLHVYTIIYGALGLSMIVIGLFKGFGVATRVIKGATSVHNQMFDGLMRCKMSFFDANPSGRILNRFSRDMDELDNKIPALFEFLMQGGFMILANLLIPVASFPAYIILIVVILSLYFLLGRGLISGIRATKQIENVMRSPVVHHISSTVSGLPVIRVFQREHLFAQRFEHLLDRHSSSNLQFRLSSVWFCLRLDELGIVLLAAVALFVVLERNISPAMVGLCLSSIYGSVTFVSFWIRMTAEFSARLTSVERCQQYISSLDYEAAAHVPEHAPPADWPRRASIEMRTVCLRYRPQLPRVLHDISLLIQPSEKLGVVGRTGAGKSTFISTLMRLVEIESGSILIDGRDISLMGLHDLRSKIDVIPQDPVLFSGTIRSNLDPFDQYSDDLLWGVLEKANLKKKVSKAKMQLEMKVTPDGANFSVGERQLICLARALLRQNRILLLDEATASVDAETDHLIQRTIQRNFKACTVITIAHRLRTVCCSDRILVMEAGRVKELDTPLELMKKEDSLFRKMMADSGVSTVEQFVQLQSSRGEEGV